MYEQPYNPFRNNIAIVKEYFKSPAVLILAIANIVSIIFSFISSFISADYMKDVMQQLSVYVDRNLVLQNANGDFGNEIVKGIRDVLASPDATMTFSLPVFPILTVIGLLLLFAKCRNGNPDSSPSGGVTILNVVAVFGVIGAVMAVIGMMIIVVALYVLYAVFQSNPSRTFSIRLGAERLRIDSVFLLILAIALTVIVVISSFFILFGAINRKRYIGSIKNSISSVELSNKGAKAYGVYCIIMAVFTGFSIISTVSSLFGNPAEEVYRRIGLHITKDMTIIYVFSLISNIIAIVITILQAKIALGYAKYIDEKKNGYGVLPEEGAPAFAPANVGVGVHTQQNPYTYLAQPKPEAPAAPAARDETFVNPYLDKEDKETAQPTCPNCGAPVDGKAPFCGQCGTKL